VGKIQISPVLKPVAPNGFIMPRVASHFFPTNETSLVHTVSLRTGLQYGIDIYTTSPTREYSDQLHG